MAERKEGVRGSVRMGGGGRGRPWEGSLLTLHLRELMMRYTQVLQQLTMPVEHQVSQRRQIIVVEDGDLVEGESVVYIAVAARLGCEGLRC